MNWIDIVWPMMGATSLTLGLIYLLVWFRERTQLSQLVFSLAAISVCALSVFELLAMRADTPEEYAQVLRWAHPPVALAIVLLVIFVRLRFHAGRLWLGVAAGGLRVASLFANFLTGANLNFQNVDALNFIRVWGGDTVAIPVGEPNPWMLLAQLSNLLLVLFFVDAIVTVWRRGSADERRRVTLVCGSMILFVVSAASWTILVVLGRVHGLLTVNLAFFSVIMVMSYELAGDVIRSTRLARQLADSESDLRESEQRMQLAAQAAGLSLWTWDLDSDESWFTEPGNTRLGLVVGEHIARDSFLARIHPEDRQVILQSLDEAVHRSGEYACEYRLPQADGSMRWLAAWGSVEYTAAGAPHLIRGVILDITERRQAEERFRLVVDGAPTAMLMVDGEGHITLANVRAERVFGYSRAELLDKSIDMLVPTSSSAGAVGIGRTVFGRRSDGSEVPVEVEINPIWIADKLFTLASITDISERLRNEREAALQRDELAHLSRVAMLGEIAGSLAHELNQPLTAVLSNAQAALRFLQRTPPDLAEVQDCLVHVVDNDKRAGEVIRRLRAMLRKEQVNYQELEINEIVQDVLRLIKSHVLDRNIDVTLDLASDLPTIRGDRVQLQQVLLNLMINACDAMDALRSGRSMTVRTHSPAGPSVPGPAINVTISDLGRGIPADELERIFTPFVSTKADGMGLGLAVCRTIIMAHRGRLWATNNTARGATLHFTLPSYATPPVPSKDA